MEQEMTGGIANGYAAVAHCRLVRSLKRRQAEYVSGFQNINRYLGNSGIKDVLAHSRSGSKFLVLCVAS